MDYEDFYIQIGRVKVGGAEGFAMSMHTPGWPPLEFIPITFADDDAGLRDKIELKEDGSLAREADVEALGKVLRQRLFPVDEENDVWSYFSQKRQDVITEEGIKKGLRIRLTIDPKAAVFNQLPWEYLFDDKVENNFIGLNDRTPIIRFMSTGLKLRSLQSYRPKLLVAVASPKDANLAQLYDLDIEERLKDIFEKSELKNYVDYTPLPSMPN